MVCRSVVWLALAAAGVLACRENRPTADQMTMSGADSTTVADPMSADSMLDTMPGGEMVRGNPDATGRLLESKTR